LRFFIYTKIIFLSIFALYILNKKVMPYGGKVKYSLKKKKKKKKKK